MRTFINMFQRVFSLLSGSCSQNINLTAYALLQYMLAQTAAVGTWRMRNLPWANECAGEATCVAIAFAICAHPHTYAFVFIVVVIVVVIIAVIRGTKSKYCCNCYSWCPQKYAIKQGITKKKRNNATAIFLHRQCIIVVVIVVMVFAQRWVMRAPAAISTATHAA